MALLRLAAGFGVTNCHVDITFISITATVDRHDDPVTKVRLIEARTADHSRLTDLYRLVDDVHTGDLTLIDAQSRFDQIVTAPHRYRRWIVTMALGLMAAGVAGMLGGGWAVALVAGLTSAAIDRILRFLRHRNLPYLFQQVVGAGFATAVAVLLLFGREVWGWPPDLLPPSLVVAAGMVVLLAGLSLVGAASDAITGYPLTAAARSFEVVLYTIGLVVGIGLMLNLASRIGIPLTLHQEYLGSIPLTVQALCGAMVAGAWALACYARLRTVAWVVLIGAFATLLRWFTMGMGLGPEMSAFVAALLVGIASVFIGARTRTPEIVLAVSGITPLLPGLAIYRGLFSLVTEESVIGGATTLVGALMIGLALAAGVTLGSYLGSPLRRRDRFTDKASMRARGTRN